MNGGFGLENMKERARQIQASFVLESELNKGTEITVSWRINAETASE